MCSKVCECAEEKVSVSLCTLWIKQAIQSAQSRHYNKRHNKSEWSQHEGAAETLHVYPHSLRLIVMMLLFGSVWGIKAGMCLCLWGRSVVLLYMCLIYLLLGNNYRHSQSFPQWRVYRLWIILNSLKSQMKSILSKDVSVLISCFKSHQNVFYKSKDWYVSWFSRLFWTPAGHALVKQSTVWFFNRWSWNLNSWHLIVGCTDLKI